MQLQLPKKDWKNRGPSPSISYKTDTTIGKTPTDTSDFLKVDIKTHLGERDSKTGTIFVPLFQTGSADVFLKFFTIFHKIIRVQELSTGPYKFGMTRNLVVGEALREFEQNP